MHFSAALLLSLVLFLPQQTNWEQDLAARHEALIQRNGPGTDTALRDQLLAMRDRDQQARGLREGKPIDLANLATIDRDLTAQLKQVFYAKGWPTIHLVGIDASNAALLLLTHSPDHAFQRDLLPQLEELSDTGKIDGSSLAIVIDKELVTSGQLQRYGSQFKQVNGQMAMYAVEDPTNLDRRRAQVMLMPMEAYKHLLEGMYHLKASNQIVNAAVPSTR